MFSTEEVVALSLEVIAFMMLNLIQQRSIAEVFVVQLVQLLTLGSGKNHESHEKSTGEEKRRVSKTYENNSSIAKILQHGLITNVAKIKLTSV